LLNVRMEEDVSEIRDVAHMDLRTNIYYRSILCLATALLPTAIAEI
jgi:hypothetical protein